MIPQTPELNAPVPLTPDPSPAGERLHPLTPVVRGARYVLFLGAAVGQQAVRSGDGRVLLLVGLAATPLAALAGLLSWRFTRYVVHGGELQLTSGVLYRRHRRVPLARVQSIDLVRPLVARVLGLAELRLEVAGRGASNARLSYLSEPQAVLLRRRLLALSAAAASSSGAASLGDAGVPGVPDVREDPGGGDDPGERTVLRVPTGTLVRSTLLGLPALILALGLLITLVVSVVSPVAVGPAALTLVTGSLGVLSVSVRQLLTEYGFTISHTAQGLRLRHGLLDTRSQTIPAGRVQAVRMTQPLLWRPFGWVRVDIDVAGYGGGPGQDSSSTSALLPVAPRDVAERLIVEVLGARPPLPLLHAPERARWRAPVQHRRLALGADPAYLVTTYGVFTQRLDVVPLAKAQSLRTTQGPWQRRLGLASVHVDVAGRQISGTTARHRDAAEAAALLARLTDLARAARR